MRRKEILNNPYFFLALALVLYFPAFLINIGDQPIIEDEAIRSLVAFEMDKSGDYITPTIGGDQYLRKPPLYNWLIVGSYKLFGNYSEMAIRFPMIISLLVFGLTIFFVVKKEMGVKMGVLNALIFITLGRVIFFESLHGLIDITFSWLTYLFFMLAYILFKRKQFLALFIVAYFIASITWMMKGLPSLVFLGISLLVLFISNKQFKMLFNWRHFAGIFIFILIVGGYYIIYFSRNDIEPGYLLNTLLGQTTRRTVLRFGWLITLKHLFTFPFEMFYHFLPWSVLWILLFVKGTFKKILSHPFLKYQLLVLVFNIIVYWSSPEVHPRYLLMLVPLLFTMITYIYYEEKEKNTKLIRVIEYIFGILLVLSVILPYISIFNDKTSPIDHILLISILLSLVMFVITVFYWKKVKMRLFWLAIALFAIRIGFDLIILPTRQQNSKEVTLKNNACELAKQTKGETINCYWNPEFENDPYYNRNPLLIRYQFYLSVAKDEIISITSEKKPGQLYLSKQEQIESLPVLNIEEVDNGNYNEMLQLFRFDFNE